MEPYEVSAWDVMWTDAHDYDPRWDYEDRLRADHADHPLLAVAQQTLDTLAARADMPFTEARVFPCDLADQDVAARYVFGTASAPVMLLDIDAHTGTRVIDPEQEVVRSVTHEIRHALQEQAADGEASFCEDDAETWRP